MIDKEDIPESFVDSKNLDEVIRAIDLALPHIEDLMHFLESIKEEMYLLESIKEEMYLPQSIKEEKKNA
jgi:squalene cyclase